MFSITRDYSFPKRLGDNLRKKYERNKRKESDLVHISDISISSCLRKQYYGRKATKELLSDDDVFNFIRGESSEHIIVELVNIGVTQVKIEFEGIVGRPDILIEDHDPKMIVELKDSAYVGKRLTPSDDIFQGYLHQLLCYMAMAGIENGIINIKYSSPELIYYKSDDLGAHYLKPKSAKLPGLESWSIFMSQDDIRRVELMDDMRRRRDIFLVALKNDTVEILPRLTGKAINWKCPKCPYYNRCWNVDDETKAALEFGREPNVIQKMEPL